MNPTSDVYAVVVGFHPVRMSLIGGATPEAWKLFVPEPEATTDIVMVLAVFDETSVWLAILVPLRTVPPITKVLVPAPVAAADIVIAVPELIRKIVVPGVMFAPDNNSPSCIPAVLAIPVTLVVPLNVPVNVVPGMIGAVLETAVTDEVPLNVPDETVVCGYQLDSKNTDDAKGLVDPGLPRPSAKFS